MKLITNAVLDELCQKAAASPRRRLNLNIHAELDDPIQRLFVAACPDSYFRPHRHKPETALVVRGRFDLLTFDDEGQVLERLELGPQAEMLGFELEAGVWHTWVSLSDDAILFETKAGPYTPLTEADFAPWAPAEGAAAVPAFLQRLRAARPGDSLA
ncbi:MAG: hypothetical protein BWY87_01045 [Deltaproteobacteria bacterium ADurb.Bin510]|nr:MAG: hypothetical protein BWY87_01045 [Deltaproteobacteria bacterium ADurb.Bin510]